MNLQEKDLPFDMRTLPHIAVRVGARILFGLLWSFLARKFAFCCTQCHNETWKARVLGASQAGEALHSSCCLGRRSRLQEHELTPLAYNSFVW